MNVMTSYEPKVSWCDSTDTEKLDGVIKSYLRTHVFEIIRKQAA